MHAPSGRRSAVVTMGLCMAAGADPKDYENPRGAYSAHNNSIPALQRRGVVFLACHNAI